LWEPRYALVDAWRGLAALGVVLYHIGAADLRVDVGHVCVMVFFVISGYCIAASADSCQRNSVSPGGYMWRRVRRIYPPYFFAICFFVATRLVKDLAGMGNQLSPSLTLWIQNLTMTQWFTLLRHPLSCAYNNQSLFVAGFWSLNYEEQFYIVMGLILFAAIYFRKGMLLGISLLMLPAFIWNLRYPSMSYGFFLEYWNAFAMGALVFFRLCKARSRRLRIAIDVLLVFFVLFSLYRGGASHTHSPRSVYFEWLVTGSFALILIGCRRLDPWFKQSWLGWALGGLALISYSMYLTHQCEMHAASMVASRLTNWGFPRFLNFPLQVIFIVTLGAIFWYFCERPFLNKPLNTKTSIRLQRS
jgi:peptidoglycan/LPS O-acetylase OafA/YrhL